MKRILVLPFLLFIIAGAAQNSPVTGFAIQVQLKPYKHSMIYLGRYYGEEIPILDSVLLNDKSEAVFKGTSSLPGGIYVIFYPDKTGAIDLLIDSGQHFSVAADINDPLNPVVTFRNSAENILLHEYEKFMNKKGEEITLLQEQLEHSTSDSAAGLLIDQLEIINNSIRAYKERIIREYPNCLLSTLFIAMREPQLPDSLKNISVGKDSAAATFFLKTHYWDGVNFWDGRLPNTPFFAAKFDKFYTEIIEKHEDSVIKEIDRMMAYASASENMSRFILSKLLYGSLDHFYKWGDEVFIHLFEKYIAAKSYSWLTADEQKRIAEKAYYLMGNIIGSPAADIELPGPDGSKQSLYTLSAKYTLLCFWDPTCDHCRETLPKLDSLYRKKWKKAGVKIFSFANESDGTREDWLNFIKEHQLSDWMNVYGSKQEESNRAASGNISYQSLYDVWFYPTFFLVDKDKKFVAKKLPFEKMIELIESLTGEK